MDFSDSDPSGVLCRVWVSDPPTTAVRPRRLSPPESSIRSLLVSCFTLDWSSCSLTRCVCLATLYVFRSSHDSPLTPSSASVYLQQGDDQRLQRTRSLRTGQHADRCRDHGSPRPVRLLLVLRSPLSPSLITCHLLFADGHKRSSRLFSLRLVFPLQLFILEGTSRADTILLHVPPHPLFPSSLALQYYNSQIHLFSLSLLPLGCRLAKSKQR